MLVGGTVSWIKGLADMAVILPVPSYFVDVDEKMIYSVCFPRWT